MAENYTLGILNDSNLNKLDLNTSLVNQNNSISYESTTNSDFFDVTFHNYTNYSQFANETTLNSTAFGSTLEQVLITIVAGFLSIFTMGGNLLVIIAFKLDKQLQTISNCFLLSLAVADFTIGLVSMPLYTLYLLMGYWPLGRILCDLWLSLDYTMSNASVANLLIICFDRYLSVTRPLTYRANRTPKKVGIMIGCAWLISVLMWTPWIFAWPHIEGKRTVPDTECYIQFLQTNYIITIATALAAFYIPVSIMTILYFKIYRETEKRQKRIPMLQASNKFHSSKKSQISTDDESSMYTTRGDISPDVDDYFEMAEPHLRTESRSIWNRCCCYKMIDRDYDAADDSSTSDPPASPGIQQGASGSQHVSFRGNSKNINRNALHLNGKPKRNSSFNNFNSTIPLYDLETIKHSPVVSPMTETTTVGSRYSNLSNCTDNSSNQPLLETDEPNEQMFTILIKFPKPSNSDSARGKPSIKMYHDSFDDEEEALVIHRRQTSCDSEFNDLTEIKLDESSFIDSSTIKTINASKVQNSYVRTDSMYSSSDSIQVLPQSNDHSKHSLPPPFGTPALGRRTRSFDVIKSASQARIVLRAANKVKHQRVKRKRQERRQDRKAAKTLSAILLAFIITWTPYNVFAVVSTFCTTCVHPTLYAFGYWLCYINSTINPLCYALCNVNFRQTFWRILRCKCQKVNYGVMRRHTGNMQTAGYQRR